MNYKGFRIENQPAYVWRMYCWHSIAGHNYIPCWYIFDSGYWKAHKEHRRSLIKANG